MTAEQQKAAEDLILLLYVDSILRTGIVSDNLTSAKSNSELVRSLESLLEHCLACPRHPSEPLPPSTSASEPATDPSISLTRLKPEYEECEAVPSFSYVQKTRPARVTIPAQEAIRQEPAVAFPETREALDVTAKFFYLPDAADEGKAAAELSLDPSWIQESLTELKTATGLEEVDTFIISFPGLVFDEGKKSAKEAEAAAWQATLHCCDDPHARPNGSVLSGTSEDRIQSQISGVWKVASGNKHLKSLGVSEFSLERLQWLVGHGGEKATTGITSTDFRKPRVGQVNTRNSCDVPSDLIEYAKKEEVELLVHNDCSDFLPPKTFTRLLARHGARLPQPLLTAQGSEMQVNGSGAEDAEKTARKALESVRAKWVLKYTVLIRDRALVADKGYIVKAARQ